MKRWNQWEVARESIKAWIAQYGHIERLQEYRTKLEKLGDNPTLEDIRKVSTPGYGLSNIRMRRCDECGRQDDDMELVELGEKIGIDVVNMYKVHICLPCLVKALQLLGP
jgi:hypothetical protein